MLGKKLINSGPTSSGANTFASENFNTVLYTGNGGTQRIGGYINRGAVFNGSSSVIQANGLNQFFNNWNDASWSAWINTTDTSAQYIACESTDSQNYKLIGSISSNKFQIVVRRSSTVYSGTSTTTMNDGNWHHIVATYQSSTGTVKGYIDGSEEISFSTGGTSSATFSVYDFCIGANKQSSNVYNPLDGKMDQVRVFNKVLSSSEVTTLYGETFASTTISTTDIFEDNSAIALYQLDGNANDTGGVSGKFGAAGIFNGSNAKIKLPNDLVNNVSPQTFSVAFWFNTDNLTSYQQAFSAYDYASGTNYGWSIYTGYSSSKVRFISYSSGGNMDFSGATTLSANTWYHCVLTYGGGYAKIYLNGSQDASTTIPGNRTYKSDHTYYIGATNNGAGGTEAHYSGRIDDVRIYTDVLTATEVGYIYNNTTASIPTDNLLAYYKLNGDARDEQQLYDGTASNVTYAYDGTASNVTYQEATKFSPDLVWIKKRSSSTSSDHVLNDSVRGANKILYSNLTNGEDTAGGAGSAYFNSFDSNGFTVGSSTYYNGSGETYVAWCFNAGTSAAASNTDGSITSTVKANTDAGFSILTFPGASGAQTVGHGLSTAPELIIMKSYDVGGTWGVYVKDLGANKYLTLNSAAAQATSTTAWNNTHPTSTVLSWQGGIVAAGSGYNNIAYCFHSVAGYQKIGTYTGNGSANGTIVETGFEPAFVMIKRTDSSANWRILDNKRSPSNPREKELYPNLSNAEGDYDAIDFLSNGFQNISTDASYNASGGTYIYLAIAADPDTTTPTVADSFDVVTYTGNDSSQDIETDFKPDLVWIKRRTSSEPHAIYDSIRGINKQLSSDSTGAEATNSSPYEGFTAFNDNGFTVGNNGGTNRAPNDYVAWCWKAGDHDDNLPQINTEGSSGGSTLESIVSVNDEAGFSIVKYTATGTAGATIGHGLSSAPELIIVKHLDGTSNYPVYVTGLSAASKYLYLNTSDAETSSSNPDEFHSTAPTSTVFSVGLSGNTNTSGGNYIAYCWYSVAGHSKIGKYTGTGVSGLEVALDFSPSFLLMKGVGATGWIIIDNKRPTPGGNYELYPHLSNSEDTSATSFLLGTNKFTVNSTGTWHNIYGTDYIYLAIK